MNRKSDYHNRKEAIEKGHVFSFEQVEDVLDLIVNRKRPDGDFGDDECNLWFLICDKLDIKY